MRLFRLAFITLAFYGHASFTVADSFKFNTPNNHGVVGLVNMPTARLYNESAFGFTAYDGEPDQKISFFAAPFDWLEASVFYTNIQGKPYPGFEEYQDYKDKGFNFKIRLKDENKLPAIAIGINDMAGTGLYGSEYIVSSYGIGKLDMHLGMGWGNMNGYDDISNPLTKIDDRFSTRAAKVGFGGNIEADNFFSGEGASVFFGLSYILNNKTILKIERDTTLSSGLIEYKENESEYSLGLDFSPNRNLTFGLSFERGNSLSLRFVYKGDKDSLPEYRYKKERDYSSEDKYSNFVNHLKDNGIGVNKIIEKEDIVGVEISQFKHSSSELIEQIIMSAKRDSKINKQIITNQKIADLVAIEGFSDNFEEQGTLVFLRESKSNFSSDTQLNIRPFIAGREGFLKLALLLENNSEYVIKDNFIFSSNIKYSIWDNFDELIFPPRNTYPAQVRSDVKDYLRNFNDGLIIGRAQLDFYQTLSKNNHLMITAGILEEMFQGYGFEYLWFDPKKSFAFGFELFDVKKRDYKLRLDTLDYENLTGHINFYYRNYFGIPFDAKVSYGEYLAGDVGSTIELSRSFSNGIEFGIFASNTNVSEEDFGEGSFDKGIFFNIPIYGNFINYSWRPLTKDPAQKLIRKNTLYDLLVKFRSSN